MRKKDEEQIDREMELDAADDKVWERDPGPRLRSRLGAQVSVRLDPDSAAVLRRVAEAMGVGYTSLLRKWVIERLRDEQSRLEVVVTPQVTQATESTIAANPVTEHTVSGSVRRVLSLTPAAEVVGARRR